MEVDQAKTPPPKRTRGKGKRKTLRGMKELCSELLTLEAGPETADLGGLAGVAATHAARRGRGLDLYETLLLAQLARAMAGDTRAATFIRDCAGDKPGDAEPGESALAPGDRALVQKLARRLEEEAQDADE